MKRFNAHISPVDAPLQQAPEVLKAVCVDATVDVFNGMVNDCMGIVSPKSLIGEQRIGIERGTRFDVLLDLGMENLLLAAGDHSCANLAAALQQSHNSSLVFATCAGDTALTLADMHVAGLAANESLIRFDFATAATDLHEGATLHRFANPMEHEPRGFLSDAKGPCNLAGANAVLGSGDDPDCGKPSLKSKRRILEDGPDLAGKLALRMAALALPFLLVLKIGNILAATGWALYTLWPAMGNHVNKAIVRVCKVDDGFLESSWVFHDSIIGELA